MNNIASTKLFIKNFDIQSLIGLVVHVDLKVYTIESIIPPGTGEKRYEVFTEEIGTGETGFFKANKITLIRLYKIFS